MYIYLSINLPFFVPTLSISIYLSIYLSIYVFIYLSICLCIYRSVYLSFLLFFPICSLLTPLFSLSVLTCFFVLSIALKDCFACSTFYPLFWDAMWLDPNSFLFLIYLWRNEKVYNLRCIIEDIHIIWSYSVI